MNFTVNTFRFLIFGPLSFALGIPCLADVAPGQPENPLEVIIVPVPMVSDATGQNILFTDNKTDQVKPESSVSSIAFDVQILANRQKANVEKRLPFSEEQALEVLKPFHASANGAGGQLWKHSDLKFSVIYRKYERDKLCARIALQPASGWPEGDFTVTANYDLNHLKRDSNLHVWVARDSQGKQVRFSSRPSRSAEDRHLIRRFAVLEHFYGGLCQPPYTRSTKDDIDALLEEFPDDVWGHAYAGLIELDGETTRDYLQNRLLMAEKDNVLVADPVVEHRLANAKRHYSYVMKRVSEVIGEPEIQRENQGLASLAPLGLVGWRGLSNTEDILTYFIESLRDIRDMENILNSGLLFSSSNILDANAVAKKLFANEENYQKLKQELERKVSFSSNEFLNFDAELQEVGKDRLTYALNILIQGRPLTSILDVEHLELSDEVKKAIAKKPVGPSNEVLEKAWSRPMNRKILEDLFAPYLTRLK